MQLWKSLINTGNEDFSNFQFDLALVLYQQALIQSLAIFDLQKAFDSDGAISAVLISYCNLADCQLELGETQKGCA